MNVRKNSQLFVENTTVDCVAKYSVPNAAIKSFLAKLSIALVCKYKETSSVMKLYIISFHLNISGDLKVCTYCSKIVLTYLNSADINSDLKSDLQALQDDLSKKFKLQMDESHLVQESSTPQRKISVGYQEERLLSQPKYLLSNADRKHILQQSTSLKVLYEDVANAMPNQNRGSDIIHCLITKNKSSNKSQAIAILTAMIEAGYIIEIETISTETSTAVRQRAFYFDENEEISQSNPSSDSDILHEFNENAFYKLLRPNEIMSNSGTFNINLDVDNSSVHLSKGSTSKISAGRLKNFKISCYFYR